MVDTSFFTQCENCDYCEKNSFGYYCQKHIVCIDNPKKDGCTWGNEKENGERKDNVD